MFWLQKKIWLECFGLIIVASVVSFWAWATTDTPDDLKIEIKMLKADVELQEDRLLLKMRRNLNKIDLKNKEIEFINQTVVEPLQDFKECVATCSVYAVKDPKRYWRLREKLAIGPDTMLNRRFEELLRCNQTCFVEYKPGH